MFVCSGRPHKHCPVAAAAKAGGVVCPTAHASATGRRSGCSVAPGQPPRACDRPTASSVQGRHPEGLTAGLSGKGTPIVSTGVPTQSATRLLMLPQHCRLCCCCCFMAQGACPWDHHMHTWMGAWHVAQRRAQHQQPIHRPGPPTQTTKCRKQICVATLLFLYQKFSSLRCRRVNERPAGLQAMLDWANCWPVQLCTA